MPKNKLKDSFYWMGGNDKNEVSYGSGEDYENLLCSDPR